MNIKKLELIKRQLFGSQKEMAQRLGISTSKMSTVFRGEQSLPGFAIAKLIADYKVCGMWLFDQTDTSNAIKYSSDFVEREKLEEVEQKLIRVMEELLELRTINNGPKKNFGTVTGKA